MPRYKRPGPRKRPMNLALPQHTRDKLEELHRRQYGMTLTEVVIRSVDFYYFVVKMGCEIRTRNGREVMVPEFLKASSKEETHV